MEYGLARPSASIGPAGADPTLLFIRFTRRRSVGDSYTPEDAQTAMVRAIEVKQWAIPGHEIGGIGQIDARHSTKGEPETGMLVVKLGGPAYRIGMGGGAASSMVQGENVSELDFNAVQRGDAEMEQKVNRVIRACVELGDGNPIISIHDQGAGGNCNVLKEIVEPAGALAIAGAKAYVDRTKQAAKAEGAMAKEEAQAKGEGQGIDQLSGQAKAAKGVLGAHQTDVDAKGQANKQQKDKHTGASQKLGGAAARGYVCL